MAIVKSKTEFKNSTNIFWWILLTLGFLCLLIYGLSFLFAKPTVETITTSPPHFNANKQPMQDAKFPGNSKKH